MAEVQKLGNVYFSLSDVDAAAHFYQDILGLKLKFRDGDRWVAFDVGGATLALAKREGAGSTSSAGPTLSLRADDLDGLVLQLRQRGASVSDPEVGHHERFARLEAPGGQTLILYEPLR